MLRTVGRAFILVFPSWVLASCALAADLPLGDASRGERLFETQNCIRCHSVAGRGEKTAPDLARKAGRDMTPGSLTGTLWNHAPTMWAGMRRQGIPLPRMSTQDASDLFAFFYSARYFDRPGDAGRGKEAFARHRCASCHGLSEGIGKAPAVATWRSLGSPIALTEAMWNHAQGMRDEFAQRGYRWSRLSGLDLNDIYVYLRNHPSISPPQDSFQISGGEGGEALLKEKGCMECHHGALALGPRTQAKSINDIAAAMWNHGQEMTAKAGTFKPGEMGTLLSYIWARPFFENTGDVKRGKKVFRAKSCATCHEDGQAPGILGPVTMMRMTSALWTHGPTMQQQMIVKGISWPRFNARDMSDLVSYLNSYRR